MARLSELKVIQNKLRISPYEEVYEFCMDTRHEISICMYTSCVEIFKNICLNFDTL